MYYYFFILGLIILGICKIFERKCKIKKAYLNIKTLVIENNQSLEIIVNEIVQCHSTQTLESILGKGIDIYLIEKKESEIKIYALNNEKVKNISDFQYNGILKKFEKQDMFYTFNIDIGSIYYRFNRPYENHILWIYIH
jgi:DNA-directed RNA polymerase beta' subunit